VITLLHQKEKGADYTVDDLEVFFFNSYPALKDKEREEYETLFSRMREIAVSDDLAVELLETHRKQYIATSIGFVALDVAEGKKDFSSLLIEIDKAKQVQEEIKEEAEFVTTSLKSLLDVTIKASGLQFRLKTLAKMLGSLRKGDFGFLFARPEVGKTTMLASEVTHMAMQLEEGHPIIWFSNEEVGEKIMLRIYQSYFDKTLVEVMSNVGAYEVEFEKQMGGRILILDRAKIHKNTIEKICEQYQPGLIILDSIDKLHGWADDRDDLVYKAIYQWAREIAKTYCPVIGVCHASAGGEGKKYLEMDDVAYAKTAKQGEADWILGIGATHNAGEEFVRYLHCSKNKQMSDPSMIEELRHGKQSVTIVPDRARFKDIIEWN